VNISGVMREKIVKLLANEENRMLHVSLGDLSINHKRMSTIGRILSSLSEEIGRRSINVTRRISQAVLSHRINPVSYHVSSQVQSSGANKSVGSARLLGAGGSMIASTQEIRLLELQKELCNLIDSDIMPRWKRNTDVVESFFNNDKYRGAISHA
jgi:hypothetical protein